MSNMKFKLNSAGVRELLQSAQMAAVCEEHANAIAGRCGPGYEVTTYTGSTRVNASVHAATPEARRENARNNTLLKATGGGA